MSTRCRLQQPGDTRYVDDLRRVPLRALRSGTQEGQERGRGELPQPISGLSLPGKDRVDKAHVVGDDIRLMNPRPLWELRLQQLLAERLRVFLGLVPLTRALSIPASIDEPIIPSISNLDYLRVDNGQDADTAQSLLLDLSHDLRQALLARCS